MSDGRYMGSSDYDMLTYARQEIEELRSALARREDQLISATNEADALRAENNRLIELIEGAPHNIMCAQVSYSPWPCNCWKSAALAQ